MIPPGLEIELTQATAESATVRKSLEEVPDDPELLTRLIRATRERIKALDGKRTGITKPLLDAKRKVDDLFRPALTAYKQADAYLRDRLKKIERKRLTAQAGAQAAALVASASGGNLGPALAKVQATKTPAAGTGASFRYKWKWVVENVEEIPREFFAVDPLLVEGHISRAGGSSADAIPPIPGIRLWREPIPVIKK